MPICDNLESRGLRPLLFLIQLPRGWELSFGGSVCPFVINREAGAYGPCFFFNTTPKGVGA
jgi:hypothetical protein